jgi:drug/metabolite transporter (DMT)-like permease
MHSFSFLVAQDFSPALSRCLRWALAPEVRVRDRKLFYGTGLRFTVTPVKYFVLLGIAAFGAIGDTLLARGMKTFGSVAPSQITHIFAAVLNPYVFLGIFFLLAFMSTYLSALSWADLTYVLPATAFSYVFIALIARFFLHEHISPIRWFGIVLITAGVGFVAGGPESSSTKKPAQNERALVDAPR